MEEVKIELTEEDLTEEELALINAEVSGKRVLGDGGGSLVSRLILRKIRGICPDGWQLSEVTLDFAVSGGIPAIGELKGAAKVKFTPEN